MKVKYMGENGNNGAVGKVKKGSSYEVSEKLWSILATSKDWEKVEEKKSKEKGGK